MLDVPPIPAASATGRRWEQLPVGPRAGHPRLPAVVDRLVGALGATTQETAELFLRAELDGIHDPLLLPNMAAALDRLETAVHGGELIAVFGDFDVDGITSTAILVEALTTLGGKAIPYLPDRFLEGYGVNSAALSALHDRGVSLVITCDCGISAVDEVAHANEIGLDVIVVDHHSIPPVLPDAVALVDPKLDGCAYPCTELAACGLAFKLAGALAARLGPAYDAAVHLDLVGLGTVCDMAPLLGENRWFARQGLAALPRTQRPGLHALARAGGFALDSADGDVFGFRIGPRLNAAGRLDHAGVAYELLTTHDPARAAELATELDRLNTQRQQTTARAVAIAEGLVVEQTAGAAVLVAGHEQIPQGIVGLVASRLTESYNRPAFIYERGPEVSRGSARGVLAFNVVEALQAAAPLLTRFGGHRQAGGFTLPTANLAAFHALLEERARKLLAGQDQRPCLRYAAEIDLDADAAALLKWRPFLGPFGVGNPEPLLLARGLAVVEARAVGDGSHLRLRLRGSGRVWSAIAFRLASAAPAPGARIDALVYVRPGRNGTPDLHVQDFAAQ